MITRRPPSASEIWPIPNQGDCIVIDRRGNPNLSPLFIPFLALLAIVFGEIIPACRQNGGCFAPPAFDGAKHSILIDLLFVPVAGIYLFLGTLFWFLYRKLRWQIVAMIAAILGEAMEFLIFRPRELNGVNVVDNPIHSFFFLLILWPLLLVSPYAIFVAMSYLWKRANGTGRSSRR